MVAIIVLQIGGGIVVNLIRGLLISGRSALRAAALAVAVVAADQATKALVRAQRAASASSDGVFPGVQLVHVRNRGVAFGLFVDGGVLLVVVGVAAVSALLVFFATHSRRPLVWLPTGLLLGGAAGNLIDRLDRGYVTDFIDLPAWPAFNVADICITFGVLSLLYVLEGPPRHAGRLRSPPTPRASGSTSSSPRTPARAPRRSG